MPPENKNLTILFEVILLLQNHITIDILYKNMGVTKRSAHRYLLALKEIGFKIGTSNSPDGKKFWIEEWPADLRKAFIKTLPQMA